MRKQTFSIACILSLTTLSTPSFSQSILDECGDINALNSTSIERVNAISVCIGKLAKEIVQRPKIPTGAVVAFTKQCSILGVGWKDFDRAGGRFIIGAGHHTNRDALGGQLTTYQKQYLNGGTESVTLSEGNMPSHSHNFTGTPIQLSGKGVQAYNAVGNPALGTDPVSMTVVPSGKIGSKGGGGAHNNMPPYISLFYCVKQ